jgi:hypothetical protein
MLHELDVHPGAAESAAGLCYNSVFQQLTFDGQKLRGSLLNRVPALFGACICLVLISACGGGSNNPSVTTPNGNTISGAILTNRAFLSNTYSGNLQIVNTETDQTAYYSSTNTNTATTNQIADLAVHIAVGSSLTFEAVSPDLTTTAVYDQNQLAIFLITNSTQVVAQTISLPAWAGMAVFSTDSKTVYVPTGNAAVTNSQPGAIQVIDVAGGTIKATYAVPSVRWVALSPSGNTLLAFADNSDSMWLIDLTASTITPVAISGFARPVNAFFSSDSNTAYVLNCGPQCGTNSPASVAQFDIPSKTIKTTVAVGGASVGLLSNNNLYVAGYPGGANGTLDAVDVSSMTRSTQNSVLINDGAQWKMALNNNQLYIGAKTCNNTSTGCLSIVNVSTMQAAPPGPALGSVTGLQSIPNRNVMYVVQGGILTIYDTSTNQLQQNQVAFRGALSDVLLIDKQ